MEKSSKGEHGQMKTAYEQHWHEVAEEVLLERLPCENHPANSPGVAGMVSWMER